MRILRKDAKRGLFKLRVETVDDLWYLSCLIAEGDVVVGKGFRKIKREGLRERAERVPATFELRVKRAEFDGKRLRVSGVIEWVSVDFLPIGEHHSLSFEVGDSLTLIKAEVSKTDLELLEEARRAASRPLLLIAAIDDSEAVLGLVREAGISFTWIKAKLPGKAYAQGHERKARREEYYSEILRGLESMEGDVTALVLAGPGFEKRRFFEYLREKRPELEEKVVIEDTGSHGRAAIFECLRRSKLRGLVEEVKLSLCQRIWEKLLAEVVKGGKAAYGLEGCKRHAELGAVETLLLSDKLYSNRRREVEEVLRAVREGRGKVYFVSSKTDLGEQLDSLGGIATLLRFRADF